MTNAAHPYELTALIVIFFLTSVVGVVTGSNSVLAVHAMLSFGIEPGTALATNMFALTFLSFGGTLPFLGTGTFDRRRLPLLVSLTLGGSVLGALLVLVVPSTTMPLLISIFMLLVATFSFLRRDAGIVPAPSTSSRTAELSGYAATFLLGIYGGFFSGGYFAKRSPIFFGCFCMTLFLSLGYTQLAYNFFLFVG